VLLSKINQARFHQFRIVHLFNRFAKRGYDISTVRLKSLTFRQFVERDVLKRLKFILIFWILFEIAIKNDFKLRVEFASKTSDFEEAIKMKSF